MSHRRHAGKALASIVLLAVAAVASAGPAGAATHAIVDFKIPGTNNQPGDLTVGGDGNVWFVNAGSNKLGHINKTGAVTLATIPTAEEQPGRDHDRIRRRRLVHRVGQRTDRPRCRRADVHVVRDPGGRRHQPARHHGRARRLPLLRVECAEQGRQVRRAHACVHPAGAAARGHRSDPDRCGRRRQPVGQRHLEERRLPGHPRGVQTRVALAGSASPARITSGPDGNIWVAEPGINHVAKITTAATPVVTQISVPGKPTGITSGPDGNLYVTQQGSNMIARVSTAGVGEVVRHSDQGLVSGRHRDRRRRQHLVQRERRQQDRPAHVRAGPLELRDRA